MTFKIVAIKPRKKPFNRKKFQQGVVGTLNDVRSGIQKDFENVTSTWKSKPAFKGKKATITSPVSRMWGNKDTWIWVSGGTKPHIIVPRRARTLRFQAGYRRKTTPGKLMGRSGGSFGSTVFARAVSHPGNKPGDFDKAAAKKWQPELEKSFRKDVERASNN